MQIANNKIKNFPSQLISRGIRETSVVNSRVIHYEIYETSFNKSNQQVFYRRYWNWSIYCSLSVYAYLL